MKSIPFTVPLSTDSSVHLYHKKIDLIPILKGTVITHIVAHLTDIIWAHLQKPEVSKYPV